MKSSEMKRKAYLLNPHLIAQFKFTLLTLTMNILDINCNYKMTEIV